MTKQERKITDDDRKKVDEEIRKLQKQIDYDTKDFTIELLVQKFEKNDFLYRIIRGHLFGEMIIKTFFWSRYY